MIVRKASRALVQVPVSPRLAPREARPGSPPASEPSFGTLEWQGNVRLSAERSGGTPAPRLQHHVRTGLLERLVVLGEGHREGPHGGRPDTARRLLAHIDALAEAGLSFPELVAFTGTTDIESPGTLWALTVLFGALDAPGAEESFDAWMASLDEAVFNDYARVVEAAEALRTQPSPSLRAVAAAWWNSPSPFLRAISVEMANPGELGGSALARSAADVSPVCLASFERLLARSPERSLTGSPERSLAPSPDSVLPATPRPSWTDIAVPSFAYEVARARVLRSDPEPLGLVRARDLRALAALGPYAMDLIAFAGDDTDDELARELALGFPTTPALLDAMGRAGLPGLFPRLTAELGGDDFDEEARRALLTVLGPLAPEGGAARSPKPWEQAIADLASAASPPAGRRPAGVPERLPASVPGRLRGGKPWSLAAVLAEMQRPDLSAQDLRVRADEVFSRTGKTTPIDWDAPGVSLEAALGALARLAR